MFRYRACIALLASVAGVASCVSPSPAPSQSAQLVEFPITLELIFKGRKVVGTLQQHEIPSLLSLPVRNGIETSSEEAYGVEMTTKGGARYRVQSCSAWHSARAKGDYAATTFDMAMERFLFETCTLLFEMQSAKRFTRSAISAFKVDHTHLSQLPASVLSVLGDDGEPAGLTTLSVEQAAGKNLADGPGGGVRVLYGGLHQWIREGGRADFNGDGAEDVLVFVGGKAIGGTMGFTEYYILTRHKPGERLLIVRSS